MRNLILSFGIFLTLIFGVPDTAAAFEAVRDFNADITLNADGSFSVTETLLYDFSGNERRGIYRTIPLTHPQHAGAWFQDRLIEINVTNVTMDGDAVPYALGGIGRELEIRVGDPERTLTGQRRYTISYTVSGALSYYDTEDPELYWDVVGTQWDVPILNAAATVHDPHGYFRSQRACYIGAEGEVRSCAVISATASSTTFTAGEIPPGAGFTIAQSLTSEVPRVIFTAWAGWLTYGGVALILFALIGSIVYRIRTFHRPDVPVVPMYEPYPGALPMYTGVLVDGRLDGRDITAGLVYLAEQGFLTIDRTERTVLFLFEIPDYELTLKRPLAEAPTHFHRTILELMFVQGTVGERVALSELKSDFSKQRQNARALAQLRTAIADDVIENGFYEHTFKLPYIVLFVMAMVGIIAIAGQWFGVGSIFLIIAVCIFVAVGISLVYRRRTALGYAALNHIKGFKDFLSVTDKERFTFHNAPEKNPQQFMEYLPYAIALGVEEEWAKAFEDVTIPEPEWYHGTSGSAWSATAFAADLGSFSGSFIGSTGSSSGSSGGGSVGGGAGGGGGGSW